MKKIKFLSLIIFMLFLGSNVVNASQNCYLCGGTFRYADSSDKNVAGCTEINLDENQCSGYFEYECTYEFESGGSQNDEVKQYKPVLKRDKNGNITLTNSGESLPMIDEMSNHLNSYKMCPDYIYYGKQGGRGYNYCKTGKFSYQNKCSIDFKYKAIEKKELTKVSTLSKNYQELECKYNDNVVLKQDKNGNIILTKNGEKQEKINFSSQVSCPNNLYENSSGCSNAGWNITKFQSVRNCSLTTYAYNSENSTNSTWKYSELTCNYNDGVVLKQDLNGKVTINTHKDSTVNIEKISSCPNNIYYIKDKQTYCNKYGWFSSKPTAARCSANETYSIQTSNSSTNESNSTQNKNESDSYKIPTVSCGGVEIPVGTISLISMGITILQVVTPIILIITGMIDFIKAVVASKEDEMKKAQNTFVRRLIMGVGVFLVILIVKIVVGLIPGDEASNGLDCLKVILGDQKVGEVQPEKESVKPSQYQSKSCSACIAECSKNPLPGINCDTKCKEECKD